MKKNSSNITAKLSAIIIAIFLWSFVISGVDPLWETDIRNVSVTLANESVLERQGLVIMEPQSITVNVRVSGKKSDVGKINSSNISAILNLSGYGEGQVRIPVSTSLIGQTGGVRIEGIYPPEILLTLDKLVSKKMDITVNTFGSLPENYVLGNITKSPQSVSVNGPRTWVNEVDRVIAMVNLDGRTATETIIAGLVIVDDEGNELRGMEMDSNLVELTVPVYRTAQVPIELQTENELPENYAITDISITPQTVMLKGGPEIGNLAKVDTKVIDINSLLETNALEVELDLPEGVELLNPDEKITVIYNIEEITTKEFIFKLEDVNIQNLERPYEIDGADLYQEIVVELSGFKTILDELDSSEIDISIDLAGLSEGTYEAEIKIAQIQGVTVESINPQPVVVNIINP